MITHTRTELAVDRMSSLALDMARQGIDAIYEGQRQTARFVSAWLDALDATYRGQRALAATLWGQPLDLFRSLPEPLLAWPSVPQPRTDQVEGDAERAALPRAPLKISGRQELIEAIVAATTADADRAAQAVDAIVGIITEALGRGDEVRLPGFGTFKVVETQARTGRNPHTGEPLAIPAGRKAVFRAGSHLREVTASTAES